MLAVKRWSGPIRNDWTVHEYFRLSDLQAFREQRVELLNGIIFEKVEPSPAHVGSRDLAREALKPAFGRGYWIRTQAPLRIGRRSMPDPDIAVVAGEPRDHKVTPTTALLVIETGDETLAYDRHRKGSLYAKSGIADYWIVNLERSRLEMYRSPVPNPTCRYGFGYSAREVFGPEAQVTPLAAPQARISVADLLP